MNINMISPTLFFNALADETRLRCVALVVQQTEACVCELTHALQLSQPKISRHLASLRAAQLLIDRREGVWAYYRLHPDLPDWAIQVLKQTVSALQTHSPFVQDLEALRTMPNRPNARCALNP